LLNQVIAKQRESDRPIVACEYDGRLGVPALFHKSLFNQLLALKGDAGAKKLIHQNLNLVASVPFPLGHIDVDTPDTYKNLF
jgi:molybdenum cofactor cytidylyltransferase